VQYTAVGPAGATKGLSMEEGRHWEGNDVRTREEVRNPSHQPNTLTQAAMQHPAPPQSLPLTRPAG
jgi:hypothetical protein